MARDSRGLEIQVGDILTYQGGYLHGAGSYWGERALGRRFEVTQLPARSGRLRVKDITGPDAVVGAEVDSKYFTKESNMPATQERLAVNDVVRFVKDHSSWGSPTAKAGDLALVADNDQSFPAIKLLDGRRYDIERSYVEKCPGDWKPANASNTREGSLVRLKFTQYALETYPAGSIHVVHGIAPEGSTISPVRLKRKESAGYDSLTYTALETFVPEAREARAMSIATAVEFVKKFAALDQPASIRSRSWDTKGLYAAVELREVGPGGTTKVTETFYKASECEAAVARIEAAQPATDVIARTDGTYFRFANESGVGIPAPDGAGKWALSEIQRCGGIVRFNGKKYRLCTEEVVKTVKPIVP